MEWIIESYDSAQIAVTHAQPVRARVSEELLFGGSYKH
jgi:hypothetical protein